MARQRKPKPDEFDLPITRRQLGEALVIGADAMLEARIDDDTARVVRLSVSYGLRAIGNHLQGVDYAAIGREFQKTGKVTWPETILRGRQQN